VDDRLPYHIRDGVRYENVNRRGAKIKLGIKDSKKKAPPVEDAETRKVKRPKTVYLVNSKKFASTATAEEMSQLFSEEDLGKEDTHRILQCKIR
jgi:hypothetical protein